MKVDISAFSQELGKLRGEVKLCDGIAGRSVEVKEKLDRVRQDEISERNETKSRESFRGRR